MIPLITHSKLSITCSMHDFMSSTPPLISPSSPPPPLINSHYSFPSSIDHSASYDDRSTNYTYPLISSDEQSISSGHYTRNSSDHSECSTDHTTSYGDPSINPKSPLHKSGDSTLAYSASVPFKWEEAPGKPISTSQELNTYDDDDDEASPPLQLPPKLHAQAYHSPLQSPYRLQSFHPSPYKVQPCTLSPCRLHHTNQNCLSTNQEVYTTPRSNPSSCISNSNNHSPDILHPHSHKLNKLCKFMLKTASWSQPQTHLSWSNFDTASDDKHNDQPAMNDRFFFDKASPKDLKYCASMTRKKPDLPLYESRREFATLPTFDLSMGDDEFESGDEQSFLPMEDLGSDSTASSPLQPIIYPGREDFHSQSWLLATANVSGDEKIEEHEGGDDGFDDVLCAGSSLDKPSQILQVSDEARSSSLPPWFLDFSPCQEEGGHVEKSGSKMSLVRVVALIKFKNSIMSKIERLKQRREAAFQNANTMWSPTLATYLYNLQKEERESIPCIEYVREEEHSSSDEEGPLTINYHLPSMIRGQLVSHNSRSNSEDPRPAGDPYINLSGSLTFPEEEDEARMAKHRMSLRDKMAESDDDEYPEQMSHFFIRSRQHTGCKRGTCKFQKTVKVLAATIKFVLVQARSGLRRPSHSSRSCINPTFGTLSPVSSQK